jgi:hypothetical protein
MKTVTLNGHFTQFGEGLHEVVFVGNFGTSDKEDAGQLASSSGATVDFANSCVPMLACTKCFGAIFGRWGR